MQLFLQNVTLTWTLAWTHTPVAPHRPGSSEGGASTFPYHKGLIMLASLVAVRSAPNFARSQGLRVQNIDICSRNQFLACAEAMVRTVQILVVDLNNCATLSTWRIRTELDNSIIQVTVLSGGSGRHEGKGQGGEVEYHVNDHIL